MGGGGVACVDAAARSVKGLVLLLEPFTPRAMPWFPLVARSPRHAFALRAAVFFSAALCFVLLLELRSSPVLRLRRRSFALRAAFFPRLAQSDHYSSTDARDATNSGAQTELRHQLASKWTVIARRSTGNPFVFFRRLSGLLTVRCKLLSRRRLSTRELKQKCANRLHRSGRRTLDA